MRNWIGPELPATEHGRQAEAWLNEFVTETGDTTQGVTDNASAVAAHNSRLGLLETPLSPVFGVAILAGWGNYGSGWSDVGVTRSSNKRVHLHGLLRRTGATLTGNAQYDVFTLPLGYRPPARYLGPVIVSRASGQLMGRVSIYPNGEVKIQCEDGFPLNGYVSLDGVSFQQG